MTLVELLTAVGIVAALTFSTIEMRDRSRQSRIHDQMRREEAALQLHRDMTLDGETANAFRRLSLVLRSEGTRIHGRTTWRMLTDKDLEPGGFLDNSDPEHNQPYADFYRVLWLFQRCDMALTRGLADQSLLNDLSGFHFWWWNELLREIRRPTSMRHLRELAAHTAEWAAQNGHLDEWNQRCAYDFGGGPAKGNESAT